MDNLMTIDELDWAIRYAETRLKPIKGIAMSRSGVDELARSIKCGMYMADSPVKLVATYMGIPVSYDESIPSGKWKELE